MKGEKMPKFEESKKNPKADKKSRRNFLKILFGAGAATLGIELGEELRNEIEEEKLVFENEAGEPGLVRVIDYDSENIELNRENVEILKNKWKEAYKENPKLKKSLEDAFFKMGEWDADLKEIFEEEGVPAKYRYLAIPESHWNLSQVSHAGAKGPYQFTKNTAEKYGLQIDGRIDERLDPLLSARACAQNLKDLYDIVEDWDFALSGYNGGFVWRYIAAAKKDNQGLSYDGFLDFLGKRANAIRDEIKEDRTTHQIEKGDTLSEIARRYGIEVSDLKQANGLSSDMIREGKALKIIFPDEEAKKRYFYKRIRGINENLNYPAKFNAIFELVEEGYVSSQLSPAYFEDRVTGEEQKSLSDIAKEAKVDIEAAINANPGVLSPEEPLPANYSVRLPKKLPKLARE